MTPTIRRAALPVVLAAIGASGAGCSNDRATPTGEVNSLAFAPNGRAIIAGLDGCGSVIVCAP